MIKDGLSKPSKRYDTRNETIQNDTFIILRAKIFSGMAHLACKMDYLACKRLKRVLFIVFIVYIDMKR